MSIWMALEKINLLTGVDRCYNLEHRHGHSPFLSKGIKTILSHWIWRWNQVGGQYSRGEGWTKCEVRKKCAEAMSILLALIMNSLSWHRSIFIATLHLLVSMPWYTWAKPPREEMTGLWHSALSQTVFSFADIFSGIATLFNEDQKKWEVCRLRYESQRCETLDKDSLPGIHAERLRGEDKRQDVVCTGISTRLISSTFGENESKKPAGR